MYGRACSSMAQFALVIIQVNAVINSNLFGSAAWISFRSTKRVGQRHLVLDFGFDLNVSAPCCGPTSPLRLIIERWIHTLLAPSPPTRPYSYCVSAVLHRVIDDFQWFALGLIDHALVYFETFVCKSTRITYVKGSFPLDYETKSLGLWQDFFKQFLSK